MARHTSTTPRSRSRSTKVRSTRRHIVNLRLLLATLAVLVVVTPALYFWYKFQLKQTADTMLVRAVNLEEEQDWSAAISYYQRYLFLRPDDSETVVRMVDVHAKRKMTPKRMASLTPLLYRALGHASDRTDLRLILAQNLLELGEYEQAELEADNLLSPPGNQAPEAPQARKIKALCMFAKARAADSPYMAEPLQELIAAVKESPEELQLAVITANALRQYRAQVPEAIDPVAHADQIMDQLIANNPQNVASLIARSRYRTRYELEGADDDLAAALAINPHHLEALLLAANAALGQQRPEDAGGLLRQAVEADPKDPRAFLVLAKMAVAKGDNAQALEWLQQGSEATEQNLDIQLALIGELISSSEEEAIKEAEKKLELVQKSIADQLVSMGSDARTQLENQLQLLQARLKLARSLTDEQPENLRAEIVADLEALLLTTEARSNHQESPIWRQTTTLLAQLASSAERWDEAAKYWEKLAVAFPENDRACEAAVAAYLNAGDAVNAIRRLDKFSQLSEGLTKNMWVQRTQAHLFLQLNRAVPDRNWSEFLDSMVTARQQEDDRWELVLAEIDYLLANMPTKPSSDEGQDESKSEQHRRAVELLQSSEKTFAKRAHVLARGGARLPATGAQSGHAARSQTVFWKQNPLR